MTFKAVSRGLCRLTIVWNWLSANDGGAWIDSSNMSARTSGRVNPNSVADGLLLSDSAARQHLQLQWFQDHWLLRESGRFFPIAFFAEGLLTLPQYTARVGVWVRRGICVTEASFFEEIKYCRFSNSVRFCVNISPGKMSGRANQGFLVLLNHQTIIPQTNADLKCIYSLFQFSGSI